jgi:hypothetical protein
MSRGDGDHSFGHCSECYWCGVDGDDPEIEKPCDERQNKKPTDEEMAKYNARQNLGEQVSNLGFEFGMHMIEWDVMVARILALAPSDSPSEPSK